MCRISEELISSRASTSHETLRCMSPIKSIENPTFITLDFELNMCIHICACVCVVSHPFLFKVTSSKCCFKDKSTYTRCVTQ